MEAKGRLRFAVPVFVLSGVAASACVDLFHSTDFETLCGVDAAACAPKDAGRAEAMPDVRDAGPTDFCASSSAQARRRAEHACAWLGACSAPFDQNAFGPCMIDAILAYDCNANPNQTITPGPLHALWDALWQVKSCADVTQALNPNGIKCSGTGYACGGDAGPSLNLECVDNVGAPESCLVEGRVCASGGACEPPDALTKCTKSSCSGTVLHDCEKTVDLGRDCQYFGAGRCIPDAGFDLGAECLPTFAHGGGTHCGATQSVTCEGDAGDTATACPTGASVSVDCKPLTGSSTCRAGTPSPVWNVAAQCMGKAACTPGCEGTDTLMGCAQGAAFPTNCMAAGLGSCHPVSLAGGTKGYACKPPDAK
jgi:hypothetical protein